MQRDEFAGNPFEGICRMVKDAGAEERRSVGKEGGVRHLGGEVANSAAVTGFPSAFM